MSEGWRQSPFVLVLEYLCHPEVRKLLTVGFGHREGFAPEAPNTLFGVCDPIKEGFKVLPDDNRGSAALLVLVL